MKTNTLPVIYVDNKQLYLQHLHSYLKRILPEIEKQPIFYYQNYLTDIDNLNLDDLNLDDLNLDDLKILQGIIKNYNNHFEIFNLIYRPNDGNTDSLAIKILNRLKYIYIHLYNKYKNHHNIEDDVTIFYERIHKNRNRIINFRRSSLEDTFNFFKIPLLTQER